MTKHIPIDPVSNEPYEPRPRCKPCPVDIGNQVQPGRFDYYPDTPTDTCDGAMSCEKQSPVTLANEFYVACQGYAGLAPMVTMAEWMDEVVYP